MLKFLDLKPLSGAIQGAADTILDYALLLAAVGAIAMALLELFKSLFLARSTYHQLQLMQWVGKDHHDILAEFFILATGRKGKTGLVFWREIFDQPSEKLLGRIQAAANAALEYPIAYPNFFAFLAQGADEDGTAWKNYVGRPPKKAQEQLDEAQLELSRRASEARARLANMVARKLDAFQTRLEYWWARGNQLAAIILGTAIFWYAVHQTRDVHTVDSLTLLVVSLLGGLVSPFAKDVVSALSGFRAKRG